MSDTPAQKGLLQAAIDLPPIPLESMDTLQQYIDGHAREVARLKHLEQEYRVTLRVLAVLTERLLQATQGERVEIGDDAMVDTPDLVAWRDESQRSVVITVSR